jgi:hypothetical protein
MRDVPKQINAGQSKPFPALIVTLDKVPMYTASKTIAAALAWAFYDCVSMLKQKKKADEKGCGPS